MNLITKVLQKEIIILNKLKHILLRLVTCTARKNRNDEGVKEQLPSLFSNDIIFFLGIFSSLGILQMYSFNKQRTTRRT